MMFSNSVISPECSKTVFCLLSSVGNAKVELFEEGKHGNVHAALGKCLWCS